MNGQRLTKKLVDAALTTHKDRFLWDSDLPGFGVRIRPSGTKIFVAQYRVGGGRAEATRRYTIGRYGLLTVDEARQEAKRVLAEAIRGADPAAARQAQRREMSVTELIELFAKSRSAVARGPWDTACRLGDRNDQTSCAV